MLTLLSDLSTLTEVLFGARLRPDAGVGGEPLARRQATAFVVEDWGRQLDVHVMRTPTAPAWNADWPYERDALDGRGVISGTAVDCATAAVQTVWHEEYELPPAHAQDLRLLRELYRSSE